MALEGIQGNTLGAYQYRPRAVLISTLGTFPVYLLKPLVNLYIGSDKRCCVGDLGVSCIYHFNVTAFTEYIILTIVCKCLLFCKYNYISGVVVHSIDFCASTNI